jgi:patatin-like phospholipase/acyl hydrolase
MGTKFKRRILSIDGGGIRGIIPAMVLNTLKSAQENE